MATYDTWGGSWGTSWGVSWTRGDTPPPPTVEADQQTHGFYQYDQSRRRNRSDENKGLRDELIRLYEGIKESTIPAVVAPVVARLEEIKAVPVRKRKTLPAASRVDWGKVVADQVAVELLRHWESLLTEDEQILLLGD